MATDPACRTGARWANTWSFRKRVAALACWLSLLAHPLHGEAADATALPPRQPARPSLPKAPAAAQAPPEPLLVGELLGYVVDEAAGPAGERRKAVVEVLGFVEQESVDALQAPPRPPQPPRSSRPAAPAGPPALQGNVPRETPQVEPDDLDLNLPGPQAAGNAPQFDAADFDAPFASADSTYSPLANAPWMFGDIFLPAGQVTIDGGEGEQGFTDIPLAGGSGAVKVAEENKALPQDRLIFPYEHFENAIRADVPYSPDFAVVNQFVRDFSVDRYTFAIEKTFLDALWSVELRLPMTGRVQYDRRASYLLGGKAGDTAIILKRLIYQTDVASAVVGLGVTLPTGSGVSGSILFNDFTIRNDSANLLPYIGYLRTPNERLFYQGFAQLDVSTGGNVVSAGFRPIGRLDEQTLLYLDLSAGYWLKRRTPGVQSGWLTGLASVLELHYARTLNDADTLTYTDFFGDQLTFGNRANRQDIVNLTVGLHTELGYRTSLRLGGVFPLSDGDNRLFDSEIRASLIQRF